jgi:SAM-dependent methyltransferase
MTDIMESGSEATWLLARERANPSLERLRDIGLQRGMSAVDVGCGAGAQLTAMLDLVGSDGRVTGVDPNPERLASARRAAPWAHNLELIPAALPSTGLADAAFDFVWSQFVFEYLPEPADSVAELVRLAKPGGRVVVSDIDGLGLDAWPMPEGVARGIELLLPLLTMGGFDIHVGRKMFNLFRQAGLRDIQVRLWPIYIAAGKGDDRFLADWEGRLVALRPLGVPAFGSEVSWDTFCREAMELLASPDALKYAVMLVTSGFR